MMALKTLSVSSASLFTLTLNPSKLRYTKKFLIFKLCFMGEYVIYIQEYPKRIWTLNTGGQWLSQAAARKQNALFGFLFNSFSLTYSCTVPSSCLDALKWFVNRGDKWFLFKCKNDTFVLRELTLKGFYGGNRAVRRTSM